MLLHHDADTSGFSSEDAEALFKEARRRTRRRRLPRGLAVAVLLGVAVIASVAGEGGGSGVIAESASRPFVDVKAFSGEGKLAFISRGTLWVLDGAAGSLRKVAATTSWGYQSVAAFGQIPQTTPVVPGSPTFSHDGRWLAYLATPQTSDGSPSELWIARANGTGAHEVAKLAVDSLVGWSPTADALAVIVDGKGWDFVGLADQRPVDVDLVFAHGTVKRVLALSTSRTRPAQVESAVWSPNGKQLAVSVANPRLSVSTTVTAYPVGGGKPTTWFSIAADKGLPGICSGCGNKQVIADLAGWWPRWGIAFWAYCCGATRNLDNTPLEVLTTPGARPRPIAQTLADGDAVAAGRGGEISLVGTTSGAGRVYSQGKAVETCTRRTLTCTALPDDTVWLGKIPRLPCLGACGQAHSPPAGTAGSAVSLEPAWSPSGTQLAYVLAPTTPTDLQTLAWFGAHELFVWNQRTHSSRKLASVSGVSAPNWSRNGRDLLYVSGDGLWLAPASGGKPVEIEWPLFPESTWKTLPVSISFNGKIDWTGQFSWSSP